MSQLNILKSRIDTKKAKIAVVGLGYVGLPLAVSFAKAGFKVIGLDTDSDRVNKVNKSVNYIADVTSQDLKILLSKKRIKATTNFKELEECDVVLICVPTPLKRKYLPDISFVLQAVRKIRQFIGKNKLIILESTTYPGTTEEVILPILESKGMRCGKDFYLAFSPERIDPGNKLFPLNKIPKVIGGINSDSSKLAQLLYRKIVKHAVIVSSPRAAETVKLIENTFRIVNIGLINEMAMMANKLKMNIWEIIDAAKTKPFGFMPFYPGPGVGGHCIPKDPLYLYWKAKKFGFDSRFIKLASQLNSSMPAYIVNRLKDMLKDRKNPVNKSKVLVLGATYKRDVKDLRKSPSLDVIELLLQDKIKVSYFDPYIPYLKFGKINLKSIKLSKDTIKKFDCVVLATDHKCINYREIIKHANLIFDTRGVLKNIKNKKIVLL
ncbi:MAG TPA: nucleotide sugar dehydrogenase [Candidatus Omnitrophota bacterium]|nr:nucleotide sugar dehydrogenase [Candidatus Omnitrophota bacterium]